MQNNPISMNRIYTEIARDHFRATGKFKSDRTKHGTATAHNKYGCRCNLCVTYYQQHIKPQATESSLNYLKKAKKHFQQTGLFISPTTKHGTAMAYKIGCRCQACLMYESIKYLKYKKVAA